MRLVPTSQSHLSQKKLVRLPAFEITASSEEGRVLDFDLETLAAGFADPQWVPQKITVASWSWVDEEEIHTVITTKEGFFSREIRAREVLAPLVEVIEQADMLTGHNLLRFDLPVLNAELLRCGLPSLKKVKVQDTIRLAKTKGLKKGQDDLSVMASGSLKKKTMNWEEWDRAYEEDSWDEIIERCESDILQHKELRLYLLKNNYLRPPQIWYPGPVQ